LYAITVDTASDRCIVAISKNLGAGVVCLPIRTRSLFKIVREFSMDLVLRLHTSVSLGSNANVTAPMVSRPDLRG
jgi:hypothetical protein